VSISPLTWTSNGLLAGGSVASQASGMSTASAGTAEVIKITAAAADRPQHRRARVEARLQSSPNPLAVKPSAAMAAPIAESVSRAGHSFPKATL
jgi:hypothetical protein